MPELGYPALTQSRHHNNLGANRREAGGYLVASPE
jgi:hypothetical protein